MELDELRNYLRPSFSAIGACVFHVVITGIITVFAWDFSKIVSVIVGLICLFMIYTLYETMREQNRFDTMIDNLKTDGNGELVMADYRAARSAFGGSLRIGSSFVFAKGSGIILPYALIKQVYQSVYRYNYVEKSRELKVVTLDGRTCTLGKLKTGGASDDEVHAVLTELFAKNPQIIIGYNNIPGKQK